MALRERVVAFVGEGNSHREAARHFRVSPRFINDIIILRRETGGLDPKRQGNPGRGKLAEVAPWVRQRIAEQGDLTADAIDLELADIHGIEVDRSSVLRLLRRLGLTQKRDLHAAEQARPDVAEARRIRTRRRQPEMANHMGRLVFLDEAWLKTNMVKTTGWTPKGERLVDHAPFGHWNTQTFIAALRHDRLDVPRVIPGAINAELFATYVETQLAPTLSPGDVVILDNLSSHKPPRAAAAP